MARPSMIASACITAVVVAALGEACIIRPAPPPQPTPPPPYGTNPYVTYGGGTPAPPGGTVPTTTLTEEEAKSEIAAYMQGPRVLKMTQGFELLAEQWAPGRADAATESATLSFEVAVEKGYCTRLVAAADSGIPNLDMYLFGDVEGTMLLDRDVAKDNYPVVSYCSAQDGSVVGEVRVVSGAGWFLINVYSKKDDGTVKRTMDVVEGG